MIRLNLLPEELRKEIELSKVNSRIRQYVYYSLTVSLVIIALYAVASFYLYTQKVELTREKALATQQINSKNESFTKAKDLAERLKLIKKISTNDIDWSLIFSEISKQTPVNVQIESFNYNKTDGRIKLRGNAVSDKDAVAFKDNLSRSEYFKYVDIESISKGSVVNNKELKSYVISLTLNFERAKQ